jgi:hypothetical protein
MEVTDSTTKDADVYMAASDNQKERPFPFKAKHIPENKYSQIVIN